jgi:hypothetical protein
MLGVACERLGQEWESAAGTGVENHLIRQEWYGTPRLDGRMLEAFGDWGWRRHPRTHAEWRIQPTVLLIAFDSEKAWCPHSCAYKSQFEDTPEAMEAPENFTYQ